MSNKKKNQQPKDKSLVIVPPSLPEAKQAMIQVATPTEFIKTRQGKGGKSFQYVEGGYVTAQLNKIFSPIGWEFKIKNINVVKTDKGQDVDVEGRLEIKDFKTGFTIGKENIGGKEYVPGMTLIDQKKSAATDCLKRCAAMLGIALDVYWGAFEGQSVAGPLTSVEGKPSKPTKPNAKQATMTGKDVYDMAKQKIESETDKTILEQYKGRLMDSNLPDKLKSRLVDLIDAKVSQ